MARTVEVPGHEPFSDPPKDYIANQSNSSLPASCCCLLGPAPFWTGHKTDGRTGDSGLTAELAGETAASILVLVKCRNINMSSVELQINQTFILPSLSLPL